MSDPRIIVALDCADKATLDDLLAMLDPKFCRIKIAITLFTRYGPSLVEACMQKGFEVFLDLKFHDIPQQMSGAVISAAKLGVWMLDVHLSAGRRGLEQVAEDLAKQVLARPPLLIGVSILTSLEQTDLLELGMQESPAELVLRLAHLAQQSGLDGIVCSPKEVASIRENFADDLLTVVPGIRLAGDASHDQRRVATPAQALGAGASYLVMGRSITQSTDPRQTLCDLQKEIGMYCHSTDPS